MDVDLELPLSLNAAFERTTPFPPFPTEILLNIFELACIHNTKTALTLCFVSKHFNDLATPLLFRSISACGSEEMLRLADCLERNPHIPPMVRDLFISQRGPEDYKEVGYNTHHLPKGMGELRLLCHTSPRIITLLSPFLETLSYIAPSTNHEDHFNHIFTAPFPRLRELTLEGRPLQFPIPIPSLECLHIYTRGCYRAIFNLGELCPRLTHLKLTDIAYDGESIEIGLKRNWGIQMDEGERKKAEQIAPLCLPTPFRYLIIQPLNLQGPGVGQLSEIWERLAALGEAGLDPMILRLEAPVGRVHHCTRAYEDWLDRIGCGEGSWKLRREYLAQS